jgi:hypothetical protein
MPLALVGIDALAGMSCTGAMIAYIDQAHGHHFGFTVNKMRKPLGHWRDIPRTYM